MATHKVLVVTPCHDRIFDSTLKQIFAQRLPDDVQFDLFCPYMGYDTSSSHQNITEKYNQARQVALTNGYTAMWCVESDMCLTSDTFDAMWRTAITGGWDIVYGLYVFRREPFGLNDYISLNNDDPQMYGYPLSNVLPDVFRQKLAENAVVQTDGVGLGNTLIMRKALDATPFVIDWARPHAAGTDHEHYSHCDWYTALEWQRLGIRSAIHYGVRTGHHTVINGQACTLWPCKQGLVPGTLFRALPYGGFDLSDTSKARHKWVDDDGIVQRYQECLCTPTDMQLNLQWLASVARGNVVELGTRYGISTTAFMVSSLVSELTTIDIDPDYTQYTRQFFKHDTRFSTITGGSTEPKVYTQFALDSIDLLFVDTEHTTQQALAELECWFGRVKPGGLVVFHDAQMPEVKHAIDLWFDRHYPTQVSEYWYPCGTVKDGNPYPVIAMRKAS